MNHRTFASRWKKDVRFFLPFCIIFLTALMIWPTKEFQGASWWEWIVLLALTPVVIAIFTTTNLAAEKLARKFDINTESALDMQKRHPMHWIADAILYFLFSLFFREEGWPSKGLLWSFRGLAIGALLLAFLTALANLLEKANRRFQPPQ